MSEPALPLDPTAPAKPSRARSALLKRLADVACLPASRVNVFERSITADLLAELLKEATADERLRLARRLSVLSDIPAILSRFLLRDDVGVAGVLLTDSAALSDLDLLDCIRAAGPEHRRLIAQRRGVSEVVAEALVETADPTVVEPLLRNDLARLSASSVEAVVAMTRDAPGLIAPLLKRGELRPSQAYVLFWWADADARRVILQRFAVSREILQDAVGDVFGLAAEEQWRDPLSRKALQFIERRQRNRTAMERSPFGSLEEAVVAAEPGLSRELAEEIAYLSGVKPATAAKIFTDLGGESLAILCKAVGLSRAGLRSLWRGLRRPDVDAEGAPTPGLLRVLEIFDLIAVDRAQTVLRYWNWSLSSALTPALLKALQDGDQEAGDEYSSSQGPSMLAVTGDFGR